MLFSSRVDGLTLCVSLPWLPELQTTFSRSNSVAARYARMPSAIHTCSAIATPGDSRFDSRFSSRRCPVIRSLAGCKTPVSDDEVIAVIIRHPREARRRRIGLRGDERSPRSKELRSLTLSDDTHCSTWQSDASATAPLLAQVAGVLARLDGGDRHF